LSAIYTECKDLSKIATERLYSILDSDPETKHFRESKLIEVARAIPAIAWAQALQDPTLRLVMLDKMKNERFFQELKDGFGEGIDSSKFDFAAATTPEQLARLIEQLGLPAEERFTRLAKKLEVPEEQLQLLADAAGAGWIKVVLEDYLRNSGIPV
jgi:hypothetical protein